LFLFMMFTGMFILLFYTLRRGPHLRFYEFVEDGIFSIISVRWIVLFLGCSHQFELAHRRFFGSQNPDFCSAAGSPEIQKRVLATYWAGATTVVVVVEAGTGAGSVTVVVRLTVVVVSVGGGVLTTSSLAQAPRQAAVPIIKMRRDNVFIFC
jgi:hypothetical protein